MPYYEMFRPASEDEDEDDAENSITIATPRYPWESGLSSSEDGQEQEAYEDSNETFPAQLGLGLEVSVEEFAEDELSEAEVNLSERVDDDIDGERVSKRRKLSHVHLSMPIYPYSAYSGWEPPLPRVRESVALEHLLQVAADERELAGEPRVEDYESFVLEDYSIYRAASAPNPDAQKPIIRSQQLVALDRLLQNGYPYLLLDGVLACGSVKHYVQGVPFKTLVVDGYGTDEVVDVQERICIQTPLGQRKVVWYQLGKPSQVYARFDKPFRWVVQFTKFFIDYLLSHDAVALDDFRHAFHEVISTQYVDTPTLQAWLDQCCRRKDFRTTVNANIEFLHKEWCGIHPGFEEKELYEHPIWQEVLTHRLCAIPRQEQIEQKTIVTPFAADCFKNMYFADQMEARQITDKSVSKRVRQLKRELRLTPYGTCPTSMQPLPPTPDSLSEAAGHGEVPVHGEVGDVVCYLAEEHGAWRTKSQAVWYAYVQNVRSEPMGTMLDVLWLYQPHDTTMGANTYYPYANELFISDNCSCGKEALPLEDIIGTVKVSWNEENPATSDLFVRQKFGTVHHNDEHYFEVLKPGHFSCCCNKKYGVFEDCLSKYQMHDTVLTRMWDAETEDNWLEPAQIIEFDVERRTVKLRQLRRAQKEDSRAPPNELLVTNHIFNGSPSNIIRKCHVLFLDQMDNIPTPYDRGGAGDLFFVRVKDAQTTTDHFALPLPKQGWKPGFNQKAPLRGLGVFCGGGNLDRGLEEGGAVRFTHAVDIAPIALHSYRANHVKTAQTHFFLGSVNDNLAQAMAGHECARRGKVKIARPGQIDVLAAGSPCPGFSPMQRDKLSKKSKSNASMVASVISYVDLYSPKYLFLENVVEMTFLAGPNKDQNVFGQVIACLVALGYQVQQHLMDAWTLGSPQHRSRIFIIATAPNMSPPEPPAYTHAHPITQNRSRNLGRSSNGKAFGMRRDDDVPFRHMTVADAVDNLPDVGDSMPQICPSWPDHRVPTFPAAHFIDRFSMIPTIPEGSSLVKAGQRCGWLAGEPLAYLRRLNSTRSHHSSTTLSRVIPSGLFSCLLTALRITDAHGGRTLHHTQHRSLSVLELKRAQGVLDDEVILGSPTEQVQVIGNMVDRKVSLALGLALRKALEAPPVVESEAPRVSLMVRRALQLMDSQLASLATPSTLSVDEAEGDHTTAIGGSLLSLFNGVPNINSERSQVCN